VAAPIPGEHGCHTDELPGGWGIDLHAIANVDADMRNARLVRVGEKDQVARLSISHGRRGIELIDRNAR
jgi:hypothetical protein